MKTPVVRHLSHFAILSVFLHAVLWAVLDRTGAGTAPVALYEGMQTLVGDTVDVDPPPNFLDEEGPLPAAASTSTKVSTPAPATPSIANRSSIQRTTGSTTTATPAAPSVYGAVGARLASDLVTTFTRALPQAASADPAWRSVSFGSAGRATVTLEIDEDGRLIKSEVTGTPSAALRTSLERTLALLGSRPFTARAAITNLSISAYVSPDDAHDGLHGDVFALSGGSFSGEVGAAFFALPPSSSAPGRRVDVELQRLH